MKPLLVHMILPAPIVVSPPAPRPRPWVNAAPTDGPKPLKSRKKRTAPPDSAAKPVRHDKVSAVRAALARGDYLTPTKLDEAIRLALESLK